MEKTQTTQTQATQATESKTSKVQTKTTPVISTKVIVFSALFMALSIILGKYLSITSGAIRISFENLPILLAGIFFGPVVGAIVGAGADIIGCLLVGYSINPFITLGALCIGLVAGCVFKVSKNYLLSVFSAHIIGSMIIKSIGMMIYFGYTWQMVLLRIPLYIGIGLAEYAVIMLIVKRNIFKDVITKNDKKK